MRTKLLAVAAALMLGTATMTMNAIAAGSDASADGWTPYYGYGYRLSNSAAGDNRNSAPPPIVFVPELLRPPIVCRETVTVRSQDGGTRQITMLRC
jgi:hypothetical protein